MDNKKFQKKRYRITIRTWFMITIITIIVVCKLSLEPGHDFIQAWGLSFLKSHGTVTTMLIGGTIYAILLSIPFVPGFELGIVIMCVMGEESILIIYLYTIIGLNLSFAVGRVLIKDEVRLFLKKKGNDFSLFKDPGEMKSIFEQSLLFGKFGTPIKLWLSKSKYIVIAILMNFPGNSILGGGGGIAMMSGMNRTISWRGFFCTVTIATSPVPLLMSLGMVTIGNFI